MKPGQTLEDALQELPLHLEELGITSGLFYQSMLPIMTTLRSGRSPRAASLAEKLRQPQEYLTALHQVLSELEKSLSQLQKNFSVKNEVAGLGETFSRLDQEMKFYRQFQETSGTFIQKLMLIVQAERLSSLGQQPINDAWEEIEKMTMKI